MITNYLSNIISETGVMGKSNKREILFKLPIFFLKELLFLSDIVPHNIIIVILYPKVTKPWDRLEMKANYISNIVSETRIIRRGNKRKKELNYLSS